MRLIPRMLVLIATLVPTWLLAAPAPDLATKQGFVATCKALPARAKALKNNAQRQAFVICHDTALVQQVYRWAENQIYHYNDRRDANGKENTFDRLEAAFHAEVLYIRNQIKEVREVLTALKLKPQEGLLLAPSQWQMDIDGDGKTEPWEQYLFAIPKRGVSPFDFHAPSNDPAYYETEYQLDAAFRVDQSDVLWALAYHQFGEGVMEILLSYKAQMTPDRPFDIVLRDAKGMQRAHTLIQQGLQTSLAMAQSVQAETDDEDEWIANPNQQSSVFPLPLDQEDFIIWKAVMYEALPLWQGKTLLVVPPMGRGTLAELAQSCKPDEGFDLHALFWQPPEHPMEIFQRMSLDEYCAPINDKRPVTGLIKMFTDTLARDAQKSEGKPGWHFLRHLYWVN